MDLFEYLMQWNSLGIKYSKLEMKKARPFGRASLVFAFAGVSHRFFLWGASASRPGITKSDLLIINKIDIAEQVHASLEVMERDSKKMRGERPFVFTNLYDGVGLEEIIRFILDKGMLDERRPRAAVTH